MQAQQRRASRSIFTINAFPSSLHSSSSTLKSHARVCGGRKRAHTKAGEGQAAGCDGGGVCLSVLRLHRVPASKIEEDETLVRAHVITHKNVTSCRLDAATKCVTFQKTFVTCHTARVCDPAYISVCDVSPCALQMHPFAFGRPPSPPLRCRCWRRRQRRGGKGQEGRSSTALYW